MEIVRRFLVVVSEIQVQLQVLGHCGRLQLYVCTIATYIDYIINVSVRSLTEGVANKIVVQSLRIFLQITRSTILYNCSCFAEFSKYNAHGISAYIRISKPSQAQNRDTKKNTSLMMNRATPRVSPFCTANVWFPRYAPSADTSRNHRIIANSVARNPNVTSVRPCA